MDGQSVGLLALLLVAGVYLLPTLIAMLRMRDNTMAIFALNLFLGWTLIFWVLALVWSLTKSQARPAEAPADESTFGKRRCPSCAEYIQRKAVKCRFCDATVEPAKGWF
jgi:hypothetical protein